MNTITISGSEHLPSLGGGYIAIKKGGREIYIASVPSFNPTGERYMESRVDNFEKFEDENGNVFFIDIYSSNAGVDWKLGVNPQKPGTEDDLLHTLEVEYEANEF